MSYHLINVLYFISLLYLIIHLISFVVLKYLNHDKRLVDIKFFNYLLNTRDILKGDK